MFVFLSHCLVERSVFQNTELTRRCLMICMIPGLKTRALVSDGLRWLRGLILRAPSRGVFPRGISTGDNRGRYRYAGESIGGEPDGQKPGLVQELPNVKKRLYVDCIPVGHHFTLFTVRSRYRTLRCLLAYC